MKKIISILICLTAIALFAFPVMGEERQVIQILIPILGGLGYEREFNNNFSFIISGNGDFAYSIPSSTNHRISLSGGMRFYNGKNNIRLYEGLYDKLEHSYCKQPDGHIDYNYLTEHIIGVLGLEWRFGKKKGPGFWIESGFSINNSYGSDELSIVDINHWVLNATINAGLAVNI